MVDALPKTVFPVKLTVEYPLTRDGDSIDSSHSTPEYPVDIRVPHTPYIPESTVYFDNPASRPPVKQQAWSQSTFLNQFDKQLSYVDSQRSDEVQPRVTSLTVAEIPYAYLISDPETGNPVAHPGLYEDEGNMTIIQFARDASVRATDIRNELDDSLPGDSRSPIRLTKLIEVTAKTSRFGTGTQQNPGRARYYTRSEAENSGDLSRTPAVYAPESKPNPDTRPLSPFIDDLEQFAPVFARECESNIFERVKLTGQNRETTTFHAVDIIR